MKPYIIPSLLSLSITITATLAISLSLPGCQEKCGNVTIPYPFGIGPNCSSNSSFIVECINSTTPILSSIKMEVVNISMSGTVVVKQMVSPMTCSHVPRSGNLSTSLQGTPFTISARYNTLVVYGCQNSVWLGANKTSTLGGCQALCDAANSAEASCNGVNCCQIPIPRRFKEIHYSYETTNATNNSFCGYVFPADKRSYKGRQLEFAPLVLEWEYGDLKGYTNPVCIYSHDYCLSIPDESGNRYRSSNSSDSCVSKNLYDFCQVYPTSFACRSKLRYYFFEDYYNSYFSNYYNGYFGHYDDYVSTRKYCGCPEWYEGNPYLPGGCHECSKQPKNFYILLILSIVVMILCALCIWYG